ncbi:MAG: translation initiation factor IF-2 [Candidatus Omnitrophica bacterium]|nr:translation initiation factor IF-2 [Candidatus Omnitrophota bacterium]
MRIYQLAKKLNLDSKKLLQRLKEIGVEAKSHMSSLDAQTIEIIEEEFKGGVFQKQKEKKPLSKKVSSKDLRPKEKGKRIKTPLTVKELAEIINIKANELIKRLMAAKIFVSVNQLLDKSDAQKIFEHLNCPFKIELIEEGEKVEEEEKKDSNIAYRPPVVTLMGHVDHGKTSLLDAIRNTYVAEKEKGKITQHIGAYRVILPKGTITFLDTPGHQAFTAMRARGANVADIVILVIAANEGLKPQTIEAIDHARAANVSIVVALNKIDLVEANNVENVKKDLQKLDLTPEKWGGKTIVVEISAKTKQGIDELLEMLLLEAEMLELKADPSCLARGVVIEAKISQGQGIITTVLVQTGNLKLGDIVVIDCYYGKVRAIIDDQGKRLKEAGPSMPVEVLGLSGLPQTGDPFYVVSNEKRAQEICWLKQKKRGKERLSYKRKVSLENLSQQIEEEKLKELKLIVKADVQGSLGALAESFNKISTPKIKINIIHQATGGVNESDIILAAVSNAVIIGFHIRASLKAEELASREAVEIKLYDVIYEAISDVKASLEGLLEPIVKEVVVGKAEIRQTFKVSKIGTIGGCFIHKGKISRNDLVHLIRNDVVIYEGKIKSLKRFKEDAREVKEGFECGIGLQNYDDIKAGDFIEAYEKEEIAQKLSD